MIYGNEHSARLLAGIAQGKPLFKYIPSEVGELVSCYTTCEKAARDGVGTRTGKVIGYILGGVAIFLAVVFFFGFIYAITFALSAIACWVYAGMRDTLDFSGTDYFIGTEGFATVSFENQRDNITEENLTRFADLSQLVSTESEYQIVYDEETKKKRGYRDYHFSFLTKPGPDGTVRYTGSAIGQHQQARQGGHPLDVDYMTYKNIEQYWTKLKLDEMDASPYDNDISFSMPREGSLPNNPMVTRFFPTQEILARPEGLIVGDRLLNDQNVKEVEIGDTQITLKLTDGAIAPGQEGNINILWENVANQLLFLIWLYRLFPVVKINSPETLRKYEVQLREAGVRIS